MAALNALRCVPRPRAVWQSSHDDLKKRVVFRENERGGALSLSLPTL